MSFKNEILLVRRPIKTNPEIKVSWAYPNTYTVGMSGLGYQLIWWLLEQELDVEVTRTFSDLGETGWESADLLGFTLSWELDYFNILSMLKGASIPLLAAERDIDCPIVFGGGPVLSANPEPFADFFDVILLGDAEITIPSLIEAWRKARFAKTRAEQLEILSTAPGAYVPSLFKYICASDDGAIERIEAVSDKISMPKKQSFAAPDDYLAHSVMLSPDGSWGDMFLLELVRSCPQECRFCLASYLTRPFRSANNDTVLERIDMAMQHTKRVGILGPSVTEHPRFAALAEELLKRPELKISISSIRMDTIDPLILKMLVALGQKSVTIALESGSERLRQIMRKNLTELEIWQGMDLIANSGIEQVKFYGIVGLPGEIEADLDETVRLLSEIKKRYKKLRIVFGVSSFVPKAQTPFQWSARDKASGDKLEYLRKKLSKIGIDVRTESHNWSDIQTYLSRADRRVTPLLLQLANSSGKLGDWKRAFKAKDNKHPAADFYIFREIPTNEFLPWSHLTETSKQTILNRQMQAAAEQISAL